MTSSRLLYSDASQTTVVLAIFESLKIFSATTSRPISSLSSWRVCRVISYVPSSHPTKLVPIALAELIQTASESLYMLETNIAACGCFSGIPYSFGAGLWILAFSQARDYELLGDPPAYWWAGALSPSHLSTHQPVDLPPMDHASVSCLTPPLLSFVAGAVSPILLTRTPTVERTFCPATSCTRMMPRVAYRRSTISTVRLFSCRRGSYCDRRWRLLACCCCSWASSHQVFR